ncbi:MAG: endopeptidase La [Thermoanaerobaculia bacterium]|nr:endopeptidase La [Thermoanaerobaculia bacterium]
MSETLSLPILPLRETVVFPGVVSPIRAGRSSTMKAIRAAVDNGDRRVFAVLQKGTDEEVAAEDLHTIGTIARIDQVQKVGPSLQLLLNGQRRGVVVRIQEEEDYLEAAVREATEILPSDDEDPSYQALQKELRERATELAEKAGLPEEIIKQVLESVDDPSSLSDLVTSYLELSAEEKQLLLETLSVEDRLRQALLHVQRQLNVAEAQADIQSKVQQELGDRQREMLLREQLKAIQDELGEGDEAGDLEELRERLAALEVSEDVRKEIDRDLSRLGRMNRESMEYQVIRTYLETVVELPWNERTEDDLDLDEAATILDEDHFGLDDVKERVLEFLAVRKLRTAREVEADEAERDESAAAAGPEDESTSKAPILLFTGPPGVGKTSIARSIARAMSREYVRISLGGARDEADIRGHRRTYVGAMPGRVIQGMRQAGSKNPVFLLDEVDKLGVSFQGDPASALLEVLDPEQNDTFVDHYLGVPFDLSEVLFIATANFPQNIPAPLMDRMEVVDFSSYTELEKLEIAKRYLVPRQIRANALDEESLTIEDSAVSRVISSYTREAGVRQLERQIGKLCRKVAHRVAAGEVERVVLAESDVADLLGRPKIHPETAAREQQVGVATGMYYTPVGGDIMFVEATTMRGKGELVLTGHLGDVMKESGRAAWSYARSHAALLGIDEERFDRDLHIHVPAGAIPKDGPSAGVTMGTAVVSTLAGKPVQHDIAMTGEVTLSGRVLPIGGVKEKVLGAVRAGITRIILPKENEADLEDLPDDVRQGLEVHPVEDLSEVLALAIEGLPAPLPQAAEGVQDQASRAPH